MPIPDYQTVMWPLLEFAGDRKEHSVREAIEFLERHFELNEKERDQRIPSGPQGLFKNRVGWARTYLVKAGLLASTRRGHFRIADRGVEVLSEGPSRLDVKYLKQFDEFREFRLLRRKQPDDQEPEPPEKDRDR